MRYLTNKALNRRMLRWYDYWLKGINTGIMDEPEVAIFDSGIRQWRYENEYPLERTKWSKFYLRSAPEDRSTEPTSGSLSLKPPKDDKPDAYRMPDSYAQLIAGQPALAYMTPPMDEDLRIWGPMSLTFYASSLQIDTAFHVKVVDLAPDGKVLQLSRGVLKASFRAIDKTLSSVGQPFHPFERQALLQPGNIYEFQIELRPMFHTLCAGHRLRLDIASEDIQYSNPQRQIDVQLLPWPVENKICHDKEHASYLLLPIIPDAPQIMPVKPPLAEIDWPLVPGSWMPDTQGWPLNDEL